MTELRQPHSRVQAAIDAHHIEYTVHDHRDFATEIKSAQDFAGVLGYEIQRITKALFLCGREEQVYAVAVCSVDQRLDFSSVAEALQVKRIELASPDELRLKVGYPSGGVSPIGLSEDISVLVDVKILGYPSVLIGGGAPAVEIELSPASLVRVSRASAQSITECLKPE